MIQKLPLFALAGLVLATRVGGLEAGPDEEPSVSDYYTRDQQLEGYISRALQHNPALQEALARYRSAQQKPSQVSKLPEPMLNFTQFIRSVESNTVNLSQTFPWFGKLSLQGQVAIKEAIIQFQEFRALEREIVVQVKRAYYELLYVERALRITREEESLLDHYERLAQARYASGEGLQQGVIKIQTELTQILDRVELLKVQRESLIAQLNTLMDQPPEAPLAVAAQSDFPAVDLQLEELYQLAERNREELKASMERIEKSERSIELAKKDYWPDLTLSGGFINVHAGEGLRGMISSTPENGKNAYNFSLGLNIPLWRDKYRAGIVEATENLIADRHSYQQIRNSIEFSVRDQVIRIQTLQEQIELYGTALIPQAEEALRSTESAYQTGQLGALDLLDSERLLLSSKLIQARYETEYLKALADLERAVGTKFPR